MARPNYRVLPPLRPEPLEEHELRRLFNDIYVALNNDTWCTCVLCRQPVNRPPLDFLYCDTCERAPNDTWQALHAIDRLRESALRRKGGAR